MALEQTIETESPKKNRRQHCKKKFKKGLTACMRLKTLLTDP